MNKPTSRRPAELRNARTGMVLALVALDALGVALALGAAYWLRIASGLLPERAFEEFPVYLRVSLLIVPIWLIIFVFNHLYDVRYVLDGLDQYTQIAKSCLYGVVSVIMLSYWVRIATLSRGWLVLAWLFGLLFVGGGRFLFRRAIYWLRRRGHLRIRTLIVGANEQGKAIARQFRVASGAGVEIVGFIDDFLPVGAIVALDEAGDAPSAKAPQRPQRRAAGAGRTQPALVSPNGRRNGPVPEEAVSLRVLGGPDRLQDVARDYNVAEVVVVTNAVAWETFQEIMQNASLDGRRAPFEVKLSPGFYEILTTGVRVTQSAFVPLLLVNRERITGVDALLKGLLDFGLGAVGLAITLPMMGLVGLMLRLTADGPVLERHQVLACGGGVFTTWKYHTGLAHTPRPLFAHPLLGMANSASQASEPAAIRESERVSWLQRFLYHTGLDKLPQVINILRGEMSWVGPRTVSVGQVAQHSAWLPNLLTVKPGITGPWAVGARRTLDDEMRLTMVYIRNWTIWLDLQILLQTALRILRRERSAAQLPER